MNFKEGSMENYCAFSKDHKCILWLDYEITRQELEECHTLCHGNWIEIEIANGSVGWTSKENVEII